MYDNLGGKIMGLAIITFAIEAIGSVISGIIMCIGDMILLGLLTMVGGVLVAWISSWFIYGFGQVIETTEATHNLLESWHDEYSRSKNAPTKLNEKVPTWKRVEQTAASKYSAEPTAATTTHNAAPIGEYIPAWKRVQMEQESKKQEE